jgi:protein-S-isoprenylcysteine O-methyltransferase Ste14
MTVLTAPGRTHAAVLAKVGYAMLFMIALPTGLVYWAVRLDRWLPLPVYGHTVLGSLLAVAGAVLVGTGMRDLWVYGGGLPASPFPPERLVTRGVYRFISDPIYVAAVLVAFGVSLATRSPGGLWIVSPTLAMAAAAFVVGFERETTLRRFGSIATPLLRLPGTGIERPAAPDRVSVYLLVFLPWLVLYQAVELLGVPPDAVPAYFSWETRLPVLPWTEAIYAGTYIFVLAAPLAANRLSDLRTFALNGLWATAIIIPFYLLVPVIAHARPIPGDGFWQSMMRLERAFDQAVTALPAFHVVWACFAAQLWATVWPRLRLLSWTIAAAIGVSCVTTGMHAIADVAAGFLAYAVVARRHVLWRRLCDGAEWIANAWGELSRGPVRLLSHGIFAALGAMVGVFVAVHLAGHDSAGWILGITVAAVAGAGVWAQVVEGSPQLLRPYGYFGSVVGAVFASIAAGADGWRLFTAFGVGSAFAQAIGRMRCLTQGCCHGREAPASIGIRYTHPRSRVVRLAALHGKSLHPTPLYSAVWILLVGAVLLRLWALAAPLSFIAGCYFILTGLGRFVEEHYRGEPQTAVVGGLRFYQWLAIAFVVGGAALTSLEAVPAPTRQALDGADVPMLLAVGVITYVAYGVDFPRSTRRFSRLV